MTKGILIGAFSIKGVVVAFIYFVFVMRFCQESGLFYIIMPWRTENYKHRLNILQYIVVKEVHHNDAKYHRSLVTHLDHYSRRSTKTLLYPVGPS